MIRNLVLKLPSLKCTSEYAFSSLYRKRSFRSLSPVQRLRSDASAVTERSVSCSRAERGNSALDISGKPQARTLCFSKEYYAKTQQPDASEVQWRESSTQIQESEEQKTKPDSVHFETLEQYELEAARPRPSKSREVFDAFASKHKKVDRYIHLQPNQMKPYGSPDNLYSPMLIRPTNSLKYPRKLKKQMAKQTVEHEAVGNTDAPARGQRHFSTTTHSTSEDSRKLSTTKRCVSREGDSTKDKNSKYLVQQNEGICFPGGRNFAGYSQLPRQNLSTYENPWTMREKYVDISPPTYQAVPRNLVDEDHSPPLQVSTPAMRKERKEAENRQGSIHYRSSYSDIIKLKLIEEQNAKSDMKGNLVISSDTLKVCANYSAAQPPEKSNKMLDALRAIPCKRTMATRSKSDIIGTENLKALMPNQHHSHYVDGAFDPVNQRNYSRMSPKNKKKSKKSTVNRPYDPECDSACAPYIKSLKNSRKPRFPYEPAKCEGENEGRKSVFLPSKVKLPVDPCLQRPDYRDCKEQPPCGIDRADACLELEPKQLPKLRVGPCPCIDPPAPTINPKLERLRFKFEDPPRVVCHPPPCDTPRADDDNPYQYKPLKPYVPQDCECVEPPPMYDVKLKRLPKCEPEEVCRPVRVCPVIDLCPERADKCFKVVPKKLPFLPASPCPCIDPPSPTIAPPIKRLDLHVPEPERVCPPPDPCADAERADDHLKLRRKKLPKFVPGDCPCEDKPMVDWNLKRLVCEDEPRDCIVPDPCKAFPRADWGCWEYTQEVCEDVDEKCLPKKSLCEKPKKEKPCRKPSICDNAGAGVLDYRNVSKRKYSNASSSSSLKLYQRMKTKSSSNRTHSKNALSSKSVTITNSQANTPPNKQSRPKVKGTSKKSANAPALQLIKLLNQLEKTSKRGDDHLLFKPEKLKKIDYNHILKTIASTTAELEKKEIAKTNAMAAQTLKKPKQNTLRVTSRAISTTEQLPQSESEMKKHKDCKAKEKCKNIKPSLKSLMCKKPCPKYHVCHDADNERECRPFCKMERVPVCCEKEESPYTAYSDNVTKEIPPYTHTKTPQWTCNRKQYGFHPVYKKEHDVLDSDKTKNGKRYSTSSLLAALPLNEAVKQTVNTCLTTNGDRLSHKSQKAKSSVDKQTTRSLTVRTSNSAVYQFPSKALLKKTTIPNLSANSSRFFATKIFQIHFPEPCKKVKTSEECYTREKVSGPKITCKTEEVCLAEDRRRCCYRDFKSDPNVVRRPPPFPAFSDCLDEEMEDILTECPLDKEKFHRMQPRFKQPPPQLLISPPPSQGKIDLLKEQECLRDKFCMDNEGVTQTCKDFGKPISLMKTKEMVKEVNRDCLIQEQLKTMKGRWPPRNLKQNRHLPHPKPNSKHREFSTFVGNGSPEITDKTTKGVKRIYVRKFHALIKNPDKSVLANNIGKLKEITQKVFPNMDETTKVIKLKDNIWRLQNPKIYQYLKRQNKISRKAGRHYTTFKTKRRWRMSKLMKNHNSARKFFSTSLLKHTAECYRGRRYFKDGGKGHGGAQDKCKLKKPCSKFTLNGCPRRMHRKRCQKIPVSQDCSKPFSPYPAYSECNPNELIAESCECGYEVEKMPDLQPRFSILNEPTTLVKEYPTQERIDRAMGIEYYKCRRGIVDEGQTIDCESFGNYFNPKKSKSDEFATDETEEQTCKKSKKNSLIEFFVPIHKKDTFAEIDETTCCSQSPKSPCKPDACDSDRKKIEDICIRECIKTIPCDLPEEEKYCICRDSCKVILDCKEKCEALNTPLPEEEKLGAEVKKRPHNKAECETSENETAKKAECAPNSPKPKCAPKPACKEIVVKPACGPKKSKSFTQLESVWQKIVNYFKARPNCPQPGDYKKKSLKEKAEKAAGAAGLVVLDPNCLPPDLLKTFKASRKDCKICPNQDVKEPIKAGNNSNSPKSNSRKFSTIFQSSRDYSKSCNNLEEINKLLDESEVKQQKLRMGISSCSLNKGFAIFPERKDTDESGAIKLSLDMELHKHVDLADLCYEDGKYKRSYFGYSNIIPSRENILERAWRVSIEAYNKYNQPRTCNFFNEIFSRVEKSIQNAEDLEKLKTESVLKELDEFLKSQDPNTNKKKK